MTTITENHFDTYYKPIAPGDPSDGYLRNDQDSAIITAPFNRIWSQISTETGLAIVNGRPYFNREGYILTEEPWTGPTYVEIDFEYGGDDA